MSDPEFMTTEQMRARILVLAKQRDDAIDAKLNAERTLARLKEECTAVGAQLEALAKVIHEGTSRVEAELMRERDEAQTALAKAARERDELHKQLADIRGKDRRDRASELRRQLQEAEAVVVALREGP